MADRAGVTVTVAFVAVAILASAAERASTGRPKGTTEGSRAVTMKKPPVEHHRRRIEPLPPGLVSRFPTEEDGEGDALNGLFAAPLGRFRYPPLPPPLPSPSGREDRRRRQESRSPSALRVEAVKKGGQQAEQEKPPQEEQQQPQQQQQAQQPQQEQQGQQQQEQQQQQDLKDGEKGPPRVVQEDNAPAAENVKLDTPAAPGHAIQQHHHDTGGGEGVAASAAADNAAEVTKEIAKEVQSDLSHARREDKGRHLMTDYSRHGENLYRHHILAPAPPTPLPPPRALNLGPPSSYPSPDSPDPFVVLPSTNRAGLHKKELEDLVKKAMLQNGGNGGGGGASTHQHPVILNRFGSSISKEKLDALHHAHHLSHSTAPKSPLAPLAHSALPLSPRMSAMHHTQFLTDLMKILGSRSPTHQVTAVTDPIVKALADKLKEKNYGNRLRYGLSGTSSVSSEEVPDGHLKKLLFPGGNATRVINWKIVNRGKQTIIIL